MMAIDFNTLPVRWVSIKDLRWDGDFISKDHLSEPERRREIDDEPIHVEMLSTGHWYIHNGRHRTLRAKARGEYEIRAHALTDSIKKWGNNAGELSEEG